MQFSEKLWKVRKQRDTKFFTTERRNKNYQRHIILQMIVLSISNRN